MQEPNFEWKEHYTNNIPTNPLQEYYCIVDVGNHARKYSVEPQYPSDDGVCVNSAAEPELYIFFEAIGRKATEDDKKSPFYNSVEYDGYVFENPSFIRAYKTMEEAKARAEVQYNAVFKYAMSFVAPDDGDNA